MWKNTKMKEDQSLRKEFFIEIKFLIRAQPSFEYCIKWVKSFEYLSMRPTYFQHSFLSSSICFSIPFLIDH